MILQRLRAGLRRLRPSLFASHPATFRMDDVGEISRLFFAEGAGQGGPWDALRDAHLELPAWYVHGLDPYSAEYARQQHRLWSAVAGIDEDYRPQQHELDVGWESADPIRFPGFYQRRDDLAVDAAGDHLLATGMILKHSALKPGDNALEYGAGFGHTALALARLGVTVCTVDISPRFCGFVNRQAEHFDVPLYAVKGPFGYNPRPGLRYQLIWFYESFHHCVDFLAVVPRLADSLADDGLLILAGEPVAEQPNAAIPYPWGLRLHSEVAAVVRRTHWFELGFTQAFLLELFRRHGLFGRRIDCPSSLFGQLYVFSRREAR